MAFNRSAFNTRGFNGRVFAPNLWPSGTRAAYRDRDLLKLVAALLKATNQFDIVQTFPLAETLGASSQRLRVAALDLGGWAEKQEWDGFASPTERNVKFVLTLAVRHQDPQARDDELDRLSQLCSNAINHQKLGGETIYQETLLTKGLWGDPEGPERRVKILGQWVQLIDNVDDHNDVRT